VAAYGQIERVHPSRGYHRRVYEQDLEQTSQTCPLQPLPRTFPHLTLFNPHSVLSVTSLNRARGAARTGTRSSDTRGDTMYTRRTFNTVPPTQTQAPWEARGKERCGTALVAAPRRSPASAIGPASTIGSGRRGGSGRRASSKRRGGSYVCGPARLASAALRARARAGDSALIADPDPESGSGPCVSRG
jgi:hypothetical protein